MIDGDEIETQSVSVRFSPADGQDSVTLVAGADVAGCLGYYVFPTDKSHDASVVFDKEDFKFAKTVVETTAPAPEPTTSGAAQLAVYGSTLISTLAYLAF